MTKKWMLIHPNQKQKPVAAAALNQIHQITHKRIQRMINHQMPQKILNQQQRIILIESQ